MAVRPLVVLRGDEGDLYARHHAALRRGVARAVNASPELIEDACQAAWTILLRAQPGRGPTLLAWLRTVAVHEAYRLLRRDRATVSLDGLTSEDHGDGDRSADDWLPALAEDRLDEQLEARRALDALASLPTRQRQYVAWKVAGHSYREIAELAGGATYTNVIFRRAVVDGVWCWDRASMTCQERSAAIRCGRRRGAHRAARRW